MKTLYFFKIIVKNFFSKKKTNSERLFFVFVLNDNLNLR